MMLSDEVQSALTEANITVIKLEAATTPMFQPLDVSPIFKRCKSHISDTTFLNKRNACSCTGDIGKCIVCTTRESSQMRLTSFIRNNMDQRFETENVAKWVKFIMNCLYTVLSQLNSKNIIMGFTQCGLYPLDYLQIAKQSKAPMTKRIRVRELRPKIMEGIQEFTSKGILHETFITELMNLPIGKIDRSRGAVSRRRVCILRSGHTYDDEDDYSRTHFTPPTAKNKGRPPNQTVSTILQGLVDVDDETRFSELDYHLRDVMNKMSQGVEKNEKIQKNKNSENPPTKLKYGATLKHLRSLYDKYIGLLNGYKEMGGDTKVFEKIQDNRILEICSQGEFLQQRDMTPSTLSTLTTPQVQPNDQTTTPLLSDSNEESSSSDDENFTHIRKKSKFF